MRVWLGHTGAQLEGSLYMCQMVKASDWEQSQI